MGVGNGQSGGDGPTARIYNGLTPGPMLTSGRRSNGARAAVAARIYNSNIA